MSNTKTFFHPLLNSIIFLVQRIPTDIQQSDLFVCGAVSHKIYAASRSLITASFTWSSTIANEDMQLNHFFAKGPRQDWKHILFSKAVASLGQQKHLFFQDTQENLVSVSDPKIQVTLSNRTDLRHDRNVRLISTNANASWLEPDPFRDRAQSCCPSNHCYCIQLQVDPEQSQLVFARCNY